MGKPIAGRNKYPFGVDGIIVNAAVLADGTKLTNVRISKQRSDNTFDLLSIDGQTLYKFLKITGLDKTGQPLPITGTDSELSDLLPNGSFCLPMYDLNTKIIGFAIKILLKKVILQDGNVLFNSDFTNETKPHPIPVTGVSVLPIAIVGFIGDTTQLVPTIVPSTATNKEVTYVSTVPGIATVSATGLITLANVGATTITTTSVDGSFSATTTVTVQAHPQGVTVLPATATLSLAGTTTQQLTSTVLPSNASNQNVTYASSAPAIATVSATGLVTAVSVGTATITVTTVDGNKTNTSVITVTA